MPHIWTLSEMDFASYLMKICKPHPPQKRKTKNKKTMKYTCTCDDYEVVKECTCRYKCVYTVYPGVAIRKQRTVLVLLGIAAALCRVETILYGQHTFIYPLENWKLLSFDSVCFSNFTGTCIVSLVFVLTCDCNRY